MARRSHIFRSTLAERNIIMCKYCDGEFLGKTGITPLLDKVNAGIEIMIDGEFLYAYCKCGIHAVQEIHFCPMCGRKLED